MEAITMNQFTENQGLVYSIIKRYVPYYDQDDLIQAGNLGILEALKGYDSRYGVKFSTYAYDFIVGEVHKYIRSDRTIKISKELTQLNQALNKASEVLTQRLMRTPTDFELSLFVDIPEQKISAIRSAVEPIRSLDYCLSEEGKELNIYDSVGQEEKALSPSVLDLKEEFKKLSKEDQDLLFNRYYEGFTQQETSRKLGISQVQVSRKETKVLQKLKGRLE